MIFVLLANAIVTSRSNVSRNAASEATLVDGHLVMDFFSPNGGS